MQEQGLVSTYTLAQFKPHTKSCNESEQKNELNRKFNQKVEMSVVVSDLTYVRVNKKVLCMCICRSLESRNRRLQYRPKQRYITRLPLIRLYSRSIFVKSRLFHTDRGNEFKNKLIDDALKTFNIQRSLSMKGCLYDNAVAEATFKIIKTEFIKGQHFDSLEELTRELHDYVHWFNHIRIHGTLGYISPIDYKLEHLKKVV